jgi:hypothetical protein
MSPPERFKLDYPSRTDIFAFIYVSLSQRCNKELSSGTQIKFSQELKIQEMHFQNKIEGPSGLGVLDATDIVILNDQRFCCCSQMFVEYYFYY